MKDLFLQSEFTNLITQILKKEFNSNFVISRLHNLLHGYGNTLFYIITNDNKKFLVNIMGKKIQDNSLLYWVEKVNNLGKIENIFYEKDFLVLYFNRSEKYNNEFIFYTYAYGNQYPKVTFATKEEKEKYVDYLSKMYKKADLKDIPKDIAI